MIRVERPETTLDPLMLPWGPLSHSGVPQTYEEDQTLTVETKFYVPVPGQGLLTHT